MPESGGNKKNKLIEVIFYLIGPKSLLSVEVWTRESIVPHLMDLCQEIALSIDIRKQVTIHISAIEFSTFYFPFTK